MTNLPSVIGNVLPTLTGTGIDLLRSSRSQKNILAYKNLENKGLAVSGGISCVNSIIDLGKTYINCKNELNIVTLQTDNERNKIDREAEVILEKCRIQELEINNQTKILEKEEKIIDYKISCLEDIENHYQYICSIYGKDSLESKEVFNQKFELISKFMEI